MQTPLAVSAFLMGLAGGPHCVVMCGGVCGAMARLPGQPGGLGLWRFHLGRLISYAGLGALAAASVRGLAWFSAQTSALRPLWTFFHVLVLCWGLLLLLAARQPAWVQDLGRGIWARAQRLLRHGLGVFASGLLWAFMPCGLLYSALLLASLGASPLDGALHLVFFVLGSSVSLIPAPWFWHRLSGFRAEWGMRLAGLLLCGVAIWALWMDLAHRVQLWCAT